MVNAEHQRQEEWTQRDMEMMIGSVPSRSPLDDWKETCDRMRHRKIATVQRLRSEHKAKLRETIWQPILVGCDVRCKDQQAEAVAELTITHMDEQVRKAIQGYNSVADARILLGSMHFPTSTYDQRTH